MHVVMVMDDHTGFLLRLRRELVLCLLKLKLTVGLCVANTRTSCKIGLMSPLKLPPLIWLLSNHLYPHSFP